MKRPNSSDSLGALMSIGPRSADEEHVNNQETTTMSGFQYECCVSEKKRRLSNEQVKALEKYFEVENKLEPERKVKLALELGLQPRQVAVWFQNRRARWKTKNLERDFGVLKANYDALKQDFETLQRDNESLFEEIRELKSKLNEDVSKSARKEEPFVSVTALELDFDDDNSNNNVEPYKNHLFVLCDSKDGSSDSDSSAILNDDDKNKSCIPLLDRRESSKIHNGSSSPTPMNVIFQLEDSATNNVDDNSKEDYQIEENNLFGEEDESCTTKFFSDEQAPTLNWYNPDEWN